MSLYEGDARLGLGSQPKRRPSHGRGIKEEEEDEIREEHKKNMEKK